MSSTTNRTPRTLAVTALLIGLTLPPGATAAPAESAWEALLRARPGLAEDTSVGRLERAVLEVLTPEQHAAFVAGADARSLVLASGETLADFLGRQPSKGLVAGGLVYFPVPTCTVVRTVQTLAGKIAAKEIRDFVVRGVTDLGSQGGSDEGCGVPVEAESIVATFQALGMDGPGRLRAWAPDAPYPAGWLIDYKPTAENLKFVNTSVLDLCLAAGCGSDFRVRAELAATHVRIEVVGYFAPLEDSDTTYSAGNQLSLTDTTFDVVEGPGSGLDADTLDGVDSTALATTSALSAHVGDSGNPHTVTLEQLTPTTSKGDLLVEDGADVVSLPAGTDGQVLVADSAEPTGLRWETVAGGAPAFPAPAPATGQVTCWDQDGHVIPCGGTGQDGHLLSGVAWPNPRFTDNGDGTVTDDLTGLIWLKNANCFGGRNWAAALTDANTLASGSCGLTDGSLAGHWRLPQVQELHSLIDYEFFHPALSNAAGTAKWTEGDAFSGVQSPNYWSSSSGAGGAAAAWIVNLGGGNVSGVFKTGSFFVWPVRGGQ